jgi:subtilase family serine protease
MKLGLQGISILFAAGDYGVTSFPGDGSASGCLGPEQLIFNPQYPSGCPYVTSVGGEHPFYPIFSSLPHFISSLSSSSYDTTADFKHQAPNSPPTAQSTTQKW